MLKLKMSISQCSCTVVPGCNKPVIGIGRRIIITQLRNNIRQLPMFPTNKDIARPIIGIHNILHALGIRLAAGCIDRETQFLG